MSTPVDQVIERHQMTILKPSRRAQHHREVVRAWTALICGFGAIIYATYSAPEGGVNWSWPYWTLLIGGGIVGGYGPWTEWFFAPLMVGMGQIVATFGYCLLMGEFTNPFFIPMLLGIAFLSFVVSGPSAIIGILAFRALHPDQPPFDAVLSLPPETTP